MDRFLLFMISFGIAWMIGTWIEYWIHRYCHSSLFVIQHRLHHATEDRTFWLIDAIIFYLPISSPGICLGLVLQNDAGKAGWIGGGFCFVLFFSWVHYHAHHRPSAIWWQGALPYHTVHHMLPFDRRRNFGVTTDIWDRAFGTKENT